MREYGQTFHRLSTKIAFIAVLAASSFGAASDENCDGKFLNPNAKALIGTAKLVRFGHNLYTDGAFLKASRRGQIVWPKLSTQMKWLEWNESLQEYELRETGAGSSILKTLSGGEEFVTLYRGAKAYEFAFFRFVKSLLGKNLDRRHVRYIVRHLDILISLKSQSASEFKVLLEDQLAKNHVYSRAESDEVIRRWIEISAKTWFRAESGHAMFTTSDRSKAHLFAIGNQMKTGVFRIKTSLLETLLSEGHLYVGMESAPELAFFDSTSLIEIINAYVDEN